MKINWFAVLRDVLIVTILGTFGTLGVSFATGGLTGTGQLIVAFVMLSAGFALSGCLAGDQRFRQLPPVAVGVWLLRLIDGLIRQSDHLAGITVGIVFVLVATLVGGAVSLAIVRPGAKTGAPAVDPPAQDPPAA